MNDLIIASTPEDAQAFEALENHHAELGGALAQYVGALAAAVADGGDAVASREGLLAWCELTLLPHLQAEDAALHPSGMLRPELRGLVEMAREGQQAMARLVEELRSAGPVAAVAAAGGLRSLFDQHLIASGEHLIPALVAATDVSVADLVQGVLPGPGEVRGEAAGEPAVDGACGCGGHDEPGYPELDARSVPHAIRHATVLGALDAVRVGGGLVLVAPHDPLPLLRQIAQRWPDVFEVSYLQRGPEDWRLLLLRGGTKPAA